VETAPTHTVFHADVNGQSDNNEGWEAHIGLDSNKLCRESSSDIDEDEGDVESALMVLAISMDS
jgi:hypothetical protein